jgi:hypothetical protein
MRSVREGSETALATQAELVKFSDSYSAAIDAFASQVAAAVDATSEIYAVPLSFRM